MYYDAYEEPYRSEKKRSKDQKEAKRTFTEAQFYRALSQLYDRVEERKAYKNLKTTAITFVSNGVTHLIAAFSSSFPDVDIATSKTIKAIYAGAALSAFLIGIILLIIYNVISKKCATKEALIREFIEREFDDAELFCNNLDEVNEFR